MRCPHLRYRVALAAIAIIAALLPAEAVVEPRVPDSIIEEAQ